MLIYEYVYDQPSVDGQPGIFGHLDSAGISPF